MLNSQAVLQSILLALSGHSLPSVAQRSIKAGQITPGDLTIYTGP